MIRELVRLRARNQLTLPAEIAEKLGVEPGSLLELTTTEDGHIELRHAQVVMAGTPEAERERRMAEEDVREGRYITFKNSSEMRQYMNEQRSQETAQKLAEQLEELQQRMQCMHVELSDTRAAIQKIGSGGFGLEAGRSSKVGEAKVR